MKRIFVLSILFTSLLYTCQQSGSSEESTSAEALKIVSLNGTITEILCALGQEEQIIGTDVTSTYPPSMHQLPKVGHNRNLSSEGIISLNPNLIIGIGKDVDEEVKQQIASTGIKTIWLEQELSVEGTESLINTIADTLNLGTEQEKIVEHIHSPLAQLKNFAIPPKVLFIYARGTGTLLVAGENTSVAQMIALSGGQNAAQGFQDYKPLTSEALVSANPDVILLFSSGLNSLEGSDGLLSVPGIAQTNAGKNKAFISMDGQYLSGFGPRVGQAALELNQKLDSLQSTSLSAQN